MKEQLKVVVGCMYSGKTSYLIEQYRRLTDAGHVVLCVTHSSDTRYGVNKIISHNKTQIDAVMLNCLRDVFGLPDYKKAEYILVEESQFFDDLVDTVLQIVEQDQKSCIVCGLDGTFDRKPFESISNLLPYADNVLKLTGKCFYCDNNALFSKRLVESKERILIGSSGMYASVCRQHFKQSR